MFRKKGSPENFIDKCFQKFLDDIHFVKKISTNGGKEALRF